MLPRLNELRRLPQIFDLGTLAIRHAACQGVRGFGCGLQGSTQRANAIVDVTFGPDVLICNTSSSLPVCRPAFLYLRCLAHHIKCSMQRLLCFDANNFTSCTSVANIPESVAKFNARGLVCCSRSRSPTGKKSSTCLTSDTTCPAQYQRHGTARDTCQAHECCLNSFSFGNGATT